MEETANLSLAPARKSFSRLGWALFLLASVTVLLQGVLGYLVSANVIVVEQPWLQWALTFAPLYLVAVPLALLVMSKAPRDECEEQAMGGENFFIFLIMCFPLMYGGNIIGTLLSSLLSGGQATNPLMGIAYDNSIVKALVTVVLAPLVEEYVFRKQLIDRTARYGEKKAILYSGLSFGLFHMNLFQFFYAFLLGMLFAYVYVRSRRLRYSVAMHMIINFIGLVLAPLLLSSIGESGLEQLSSGQMDPEAMAAILPQVAGFGLYVIALVGLSIAGLVLLITRVPKLVFRPAEEELPKGKVLSTVYLRPGYVLFVLVCAAICVITMLSML